MIAQKEGRSRRPGKVVTATYLENAGLYYLGRFAATRERVRQVLMRKVQRSAKEHGTDPQEGAQIIEKLLDRWVDQGLVRDRDLALSKAGSLQRRGTSLRGIRAKLGAAGVESADADAAITRLREETDGDLDLDAAWSLARRRKLGPYRREEDREDNRQRDLGSLARAGFSYATAHRVIDASEPRPR
jgi:regulatory protein